MNILIFDVETTGTDPAKDRVIELCTKKLDGPATTSRFNPAPATISPQAEKVHGISMKDLEKEDTFAKWSQILFDLFNTADVLMGYNVKFDIAMMEAEFKRTGHTIDLLSKLVVDPYKMWLQKEPRKLTDATQYFLGEDLKGAHEAEADVKATEKVFQAMVDKYGLQEATWDEMATVCEPNRARWVGATRHFEWDANGKVIFAFGKHAGKRAYHEKGYLDWMLKQDFPENVKTTIRKMLAGELTPPKEP